MGGRVETEGSRGWELTEGPSAVTVTECVLPKVTSSARLRDMAGLGMCHHSV